MPHRRTNHTFTRCVSTAYDRSIAATKGQYSRGRGVKPKVAPTHVKGSAMPTMQIVMLVAINAELARLSIKGILAVRIM